MEVWGHRAWCLASGVQEPTAASAPTQMSKLRARRCRGCWSGSPRVSAVSRCLQGSEGGPSLDDRRWPGPENRGWLEPGDTVVAGSWWRECGQSQGYRGGGVSRDTWWTEPGVEGILDGWGTEDWGRCKQRARAGPGKSQNFCSAVHNFCSAVPPSSV